ncbi:MAG: GNAT family N-acetyltransferase [Promethearchaeota archaeon]
MSLNPLKIELTVRILEDPNEILKYLYIGTNIPIWPEFHKYIIRDLKLFHAKTILLLENGNPTGNVLVYHNDPDILYFGYFGVIYNNPAKINRLIDELLNYGKLNNFKSILGPINIPGIIFGWGFMEKSKISNLFIQNPVNPPIYQKLFLKRGFSIYNVQNTWEGYLIRINPWKIKKYDFSNYEYFNPKDFDELMKLKPIFLKIQLENLPESTQITPRNPNVFDNYVEFIFDFGYNFMVFFIRYKPTKDIVACGSFLPNPFRTDERGNFNSCVVFTMAIKPEHRGKGLGQLMYGATTLQLREKKIRYGIAPILGDIKTATEWAKSLGGIIGRTHIILKYIINED